MLSKNESSVVIVRLVAKNAVVRQILISMVFYL